MSFLFSESKAKGIFLQQFRKFREQKLIDLDVQYMKALESNDTGSQQTIVNDKEELRNFPTTVNNTSVTSKQELQNMWYSSSFDNPESFWL